MAIVGTPITSSSGAYLTYATADLFFSDRIDSAVWDAATTANKTKSLKQATAIIDNMAWQGYKLLSTQDRAFPRKYDPTDSINPWGNTYSEDSWGYIYETDDVPQAVLDACCLIAQSLLSENSSTSAVSEKDLQEKGVSSFSLGKLSMSFRDGFDSSYAGLRSKEAYDLLSPYMQRRGDIR